MKPNYDQLIWEACGSPMRYDPSMDTPGYGVDVARKPIDITLAHVMQLLEKVAIIYRGVVDGFLIIEILQGDLRDEFIFLKLLKNNEAANCSDQSDETKETICKILNLIEETK